VAGPKPGDGLSRRPGTHDDPGHLHAIPNFAIGYLPMIRLTLLIGLMVAAPALAHDAWIQTNTNLVRAGDVVHIDLMLGNHGNEHRDFKLAGKPSLEGATLEVIDPQGRRYDLRDRLTDTGYTPQEGYWTARFEPAEPGLYLVTHRSERVMTYAPERSIKGAKAYFVASPSLDRPPATNPGFDRPLGHDLELVPVVNPVTPMGPGSPIKVRLLYKGKPLAGQRVAFIPRGATLKPGFDDRYERTTDPRGEVTFEPTEANVYLIAAHKDEPTQGGSLDGKSYRFTKYSATLSLFVPRLCPCCGG
jgi:uncharacterized GH25 family protein